MKIVPGKGRKDPSVNLRCGLCKYQITCFKNHTKFEILTIKCDNCESAFVRVNYSVKESPFPLSANQHSGCIYCDDVFKGIIELPMTKKVSEKKPAEPVNIGEDGKNLPIQTSEAPKPTTVGIISKKKKKRR